MSAAVASAAPTERRATPYGLVLGLLLPIAAVNALAFVLPSLSLLRMSFNRAMPGGGVREAVTLENYLSVMTDPFYLELVLNSIGISLVITLLTLACAYPIALYVHRTAPAWRNVLVLLCVSPLLVSAVVRTYGWLVILGDQGFINGLLRSLDVINRPLPLVFNTTGVVIGLVEILMPYMILSLLAGFGRLDRAYEEAARSLGARPWRAFVRVTFPLSLPGVALGCLLCFVLAISSFITPKLLGGGRVFLLATEIYDQAIVTLNWPVAATLSMLILVIFGAAMLAYARVVRALD